MACFLGALRVVPGGSARSIGASLSRWPCEIDRAVFRRRAPLFFGCREKVLASLSSIGDKKNKREIKMAPRDLAIIARPSGGRRLRLFWCAQRLSHAVCAFLFLFTPGDLALFHLLDASPRRRSTFLPASVPHLPMPSDAILLFPCSLDKKKEKEERGKREGETDGQPYDLEKRTRRCDGRLFDRACVREIQPCALARCPTSDAADAPLHARRTLRETRPTRCITTARPPSRGRRCPTS